MIPESIEQVMDRALMAVQRGDEMQFAVVVNSLTVLLENALTPAERSFVTLVVAELDQIPLSADTLREVAALRVWVLTSMVRRGWIVEGNHAL